MAPLFSQVPALAPPLSCQVGVLAAPLRQRNADGRRGPLWLPIPLLEAGAERDRSRCDGESRSNVPRPKIFGTPTYGSYENMEELQDWGRGGVDGFQVSNTEGYVINPSHVSISLIRGCALCSSTISGR